MIPYDPAAEHTGLSSKPPNLNPEWRRTPHENQSHGNLYCSGRDLVFLLSQRRHSLPTSPGAPSCHRHPPVQCLPERILIPTWLQSIYKTKTPKQQTLQPWHSTPAWTRGAQHTVISKLIATFTQKKEREEMHH